MTLFHTYEEYYFYYQNLIELTRKYDVEMYHYSLMPNHMHLLLSPTCENLPVFMKELQNRYAKRFCMLYSYQGHVWQGRYKIRTIQGDTDLYACGNYIEMNPVRAGLVKTPEDWEFSSYRHYAFGKQDILINTNPFYKALGNTTQERQRIYRETVSLTRA